MSKSVKPSHATWLSPYMRVQDVDAAAKFYQQAFGFEVLELAPGEDGSTWHAELRYKDQLIMMGKQGAYEKGEQVPKSPVSSGVVCPINLYLYCEDVDKFYQHAIANGATSVFEPGDMVWGDRMCNLKDPEGYVWCFATHLGEQ